MRTAILSVFLAISTVGAQQAPPKSSGAQGEPALSVLCAPGTTMQVGVPYASPVIASGGTGAYQFAITGGSLPGGLALNPATGTITGTPVSDGAFSYTVQVTDSGGAMATTGNTPCVLGTPSNAAPKPGTLPTSGGGRPAVLSDPAVGGNKPVIASPEIDPVKMAQPRDKAIEAAAQAVQLDDHPFILGAEDMLTVSVYGSPEFGGQHMVRPDGMITMPFLGDIKAAGYAPAELGSLIKEKLKKYIVDPDVSVQVNQVNSKKYYIQGEVMRTGGFPLLVPTRVLEALVNAGGFRDFANKKKIVVMRLTGERLKFNYNEVIQGKKMDQNVFLKPNDIIIVK